MLHSKNLLNKIYNLNSSFSLTSVNKTSELLKKKNTKKNYFLGLKKKNNRKRRKEKTTFWLFS